jgi:hypothetical protein
MGNGQFNANNQSLRPPVVERQIAAMGQHNVARDRKAETESGCLIDGPCLVAAHEWLEHGALSAFQPLALCSLVRAPFGVAEKLRECR